MSYSPLIYDVTKYGLKGNSSQDNSALLNTLLNTIAPTGSTIVFPRSIGDYNFSVVTVVSNKYFNFVGNQSTLNMTGNSQILNMSSTVALTGSGSRWTFEGFTFNGTGIGGAQTGLFFSNFSGLFTVNCCKFTNWGNAAITVINTQNASTTQAGSLGGTISSCKFFNNPVRAINLLAGGEYVQIIGCQGISNGIFIFNSGGNSIIKGNTGSYNATALEISTSANAGKDIVSGNHFTHNTANNINIHDLPATQGVHLIDNHLIVGTLRLENNLSTVMITGGQINVDAYVFNTNLAVIFNDVLFTNSLANTITLTGTSPRYVDCWDITGKQAIDADTFTVVMPFKYSLIGSAVLDFPDTVAGTASDLTILVVGAALGDPIALGVPNSSIMANGVFTAWVSVAGTVTVRFTNTNLAGNLNPPSGTFNLVLFKL